MIERNANTWPVTIAGYMHNPLYKHLYVYIKNGIYMKTIKERNILLAHKMMLTNNDRHRGGDSRASSIHLKGKKS